MHLGLRTRDLLLISLLTVVVVVTTSVVHIGHVTQLSLERSRAGATAAARELLAIAQRALARRQPETAEDAIEALREAEELRTLADAQLASVPGLVSVELVTHSGDRVLGTEDAASALPTARIDELLALSAWRQFLVLRGRGQLAEVVLELDRAGEPFGELRLATDTSLVREELDLVLRTAAKLMGFGLAGAWMVALVVARLGRRPMRRLAQQIDRWRGGEWDFQIDGRLDADARDLAEKLTALGERMRSERLKLLGRTATLEHIMNQLQGGIVLLDAGHEIAFCNRSAAELFDRSAEEVAGSHVEDALGADHPLCRLLAAAAEEGAAIEDLPCQLPDEGRFRESLVSVFPVQGPGEAIDGWVVLLEGLGSFRALQELAGVGAELAQLTTLSSELVHDVKSPLHVMALRLEHLRQELRDVSPEARRSLSTLEDHLRFLDHLVTGFLDFVRAAQLEPVPTDLEPILRGLVGRLAGDAGSVSAAVEIEGAVVVPGNAHLLERAFENLLRNAREAMPDGGEISVRASAAGDEVVVEVEDSGIGMSAGAQERAMHHYYTTKAKGHGMGLAFVQRVVSEHGGRLELDSAPGRGTRVVVHLPAAQPVAGSVAERDGEAR